MGAEVTAWDDAAGRTRRSRRRAAARSVRRAISRSTRWCCRPAFRTCCRSRIPPRTRARAAGVPILSDAELLFQAVRRAGSRARFAGITGTNGKSTTTALLAHILDCAGVPVAAGGNLGTGRVGAAAAAGRRHLCAGDVVLHVGATRHAPLRCRGDAQSQPRPHGSPRRHGRLYRRETRDLRPPEPRATWRWSAIDDADSRAMADALHAGPAQVVTVSGECNPAAHCGLGPRSGSRSGGGGVSLADSAAAPALPGAHNAQNAAAAYAMARFLGVSRDTIAHAFTSLPRTAAPPAAPGHDRRHHLHQRQQGDQCRCRRVCAVLL